MMSGLEKILDVSTGGFLLPRQEDAAAANAANNEESKKQGGPGGMQQLNPVMTPDQQESIKQMLTKIDQLLTRECVLCGDFLLDMVGSAVIPDEPMNQAVVELVDQHSYTINLRTG